MDTVRASIIPVCNCLLYLCSYLTHRSLLVTQFSSHCLIHFNDSLTFPFEILDFPLYNKCVLFDSEVATYSKIKIQITGNLSFYATCTVNTMNIIEISFFLA